MKKHKCVGCGGPVGKVLTCFCGPTGAARIYCMTCMQELGMMAFNNPWHAIREEDTKPTGRKRLKR